MTETHPDLFKDGININIRLNRTQTPAVLRSTPSFKLKRQRQRSKAAFKEIKLAGNSLTYLNLFTLKTLCSVGQE